MIDRRRRYFAITSWATELGTRTQLDRPYGIEL